MSKKSEQQYRQCKLEKATPTGGKWVDVAYIPAKYAKVGKTLVIKDPATDEWNDGWLVVEAGSTLVDYELLDNQRDAWKCFEDVLGK